MATYGYNNVGNLQSVTYGNGAAHTYSYDTRNRLANLSVAPASSPASTLFSYAYTVDAAGHRTSVTEKSGGAFIGNPIAFLLEPIGRHYENGVKIGR